MVRITKTPEERHSEIIDVAMRLFGERGYEGTSVSDVVKALGVAQGTFYYHFKSKSEVLDAAVERVTEELGARVDAVVENAEVGAVEQLKLIGSVLVGAMAENHELIAFFTTPGNEFLHERMHAKLLERLVPALTRVIESGVEAGVFDIPYPQEAVEVLVAMLTQVARQSGNLADAARVGRIHQTALLVVTRFLGIT